MNWPGQISRMLKGAIAAVQHPRRTAGYLLGLAAEEKHAAAMARIGLAQGLPTVNLLDLFPDFAEEVTPFTYLEGGSPALDLGLLRRLARQRPGTNYFEIGTWRGESVANVAAVAAHCYALTLSDVEMRAAGWGEEFVATARCLSNGIPNITHLLHNSRTFDYAPYAGKMDLVFVDGDHRYEGVLADTRNAFRLLRDKDSIVVWHDYMRSPERDIVWELLAAIMDGCPPERRRDIYHVSNTLCAVCLPAAFRPAARHWKFPARPDKVFRVGIAASRIPEKAN
jgi:predicted O-methyltransferase YrrM